ncbi:MAG: hemerythrin domain-containing protein [Labilithrix sp.]|nr:hemerythrin domain-containing protein [Labilithrix sp.]
MGSEEVNDDVPLSAGQIRTRILQDNAVVRAHLVKVKALVPECGVGAPETFELLVSAALALVDEMRGHLALEDRMLVPALEAADAWGPVRRERVEMEHAKVREELDMLADRLRTTRGFDRDLALTVEALINELFAEIAAEEREALDPDTLRDDVVAIGQTDG